jgi:hypothetical protein
LKEVSFSEEHREIWRNRRVRLFVCLVPWWRECRWRTMLFLWKGGDTTTTSMRQYRRQHHTHAHPDQCMFAHILMMYITSITTGLFACVYSGTSIHFRHDSSSTLQVFCSDEESYGCGRGMIPAVLKAVFIWSLDWSRNVRKMYFYHWNHTSHNGNTIHFLLYSMRSLSVLGGGI